MSASSSLLPEPLTLHSRRFKSDTSSLALQGCDDLPEAETWVKALRLRAQNSVLERGLPTNRLERWKFTNLPAKLKKLNFEYTPGKGTPVSDAPDWARARLEEALPGDARHHDMMLWDASNAHLDKAMFLQFTDQQKHVLKFQGFDGQYTCPRMFICVADHADSVLIEHCGGQGAYWRNSVAQIRIGKNARLRHYRIQDDSKDAVYTQNTHICIERDGTYEAFTLTAGADLSRNQIHAELMAPNSQCNLYGLNLLNGQQHGDTTLTVEHHAPHCQSNQYYKTLLDGQARGVFQGKIHVDQAAQKTDGYQLSNNLLLSQAAEMNVKPELEIYADDVKCSHGSTTGQLDETPLFYLRSRGLNENQARQLLMEAFIGEVVEKITDEGFREIVSERASVWLARL